MADYSGSYIGEDGQAPPLIGGYEGSGSSSRSIIEGATAGAMVGGPWGAVIGGAASLLGGILGNKASARQAEANRAWQEYMSNTAHQREVRDLRAAGLNPILSATGGRGASTPVGAQATQSDFLSPAVSSAREGLRATADIANTAANTRLQSEQAESVPVQRDNTREMTRLTSNQANHELIKQINTTHDSELKVKLQEELDSRMRLQAAQTRSEEGKPALLKAETHATSALASQRQSENVLRRVDADFYGSSAGRAARYIELGAKPGKAVVDVINPFRYKPRSKPRP